MFLNGSYYFPDTEIDCRKGDGKGGSEIRLSGNYTVEECITEVKNQYPKDEAYFSKILKANNPIIYLG